MLTSVLLDKAATTAEAKMDSRKTYMRLRRSPGDTGCKDVNIGDFDNCHKNVERKPLNVKHGWIV